MFRLSKRYPLDLDASTNCSGNEWVYYCCGGCKNFPSASRTSKQQIYIMVMEEARISNTLSSPIAGIYASLTSIPTVLSQLYTMNTKFQGNDFFEQISLPDFTLLTPSNRSFIFGLSLPLLVPFLLVLSLVFIPGFFILRKDPFF